MPDRSLGQIGYEAFRDLLVGRDIWNADFTVPWHEVGENSKDAWQAAAKAVIESANEPAP